jgi:NADPH-ferrihemoprotein reductase
MEYAMMGLGDRSYEEFNEMAVFCNKNMCKMGGTLLYELGEADQETYSTEDDFMKWKEQLWQSLFAHFGKD